MGAFVLRRLAVAAPVLLGITAISYLIINLAPGSPIDLLIDPNLSPLDVERKRAELGLDQPLPVRYALWLGELLRGNLGYSIVNYQPVAARIGERVAPTLTLMGAALLIAYLIAIPIGLVSALRQYSTVDFMATVTALLGVSTPSFFLGLGLIYLFALRAPILPTGGLATPGLEGDLADRLSHLVLPAVVLGAAQAASLMRYTRAAALEVIGQDYVRTARAKGLVERRVVVGHILRNSLIPVITLLGASLPHLFGGAVITEQVFQWPGMGRLAIEAVTQRDYPVLMGLTLMTATLVIVGSLVADVLYAVVDPRITYR